MAELSIHRELPCNPANYRRGRTRAVRYLVIHYVGALGGARENAAWYHRDTPGISAHYFVGHASEGAAVYASVPEGDTAQHCGRTDGKYRHPECRNANSIGIEMCCHQDGAGNWYFDAETVDAAVALAQDVMARHGIPVENVVRHYDVTGKLCPAPYVNDTGAWEAFKRRLAEEEKMKQSEFESLYEKINPLYTALEQVPEYWREETAALTRAGALKGDGTHPLHIRHEALGALVAAARLAKGTA